MLEEWIIHVTISSWIDSEHVATTLALNDRLTDVVFVLEVCCFFQRLKEWRELNWIVINESVNALLDLVA